MYKILVPKALKAVAREFLTEKGHPALGMDPMM